MGGEEKLKIKGNRITFYSFEFTTICKWMSEQVMGGIIKKKTK